MCEHRSTRVRSGRVVCGHASVVSPCSHGSLGPFVSLCVSMNVCPTFPCKPMAGRVSRESFQLMFAEGLVSARSPAKSLCALSCCYPHNDTQRLVLLLPHLTVEESEAQRG